MNEDRLYLSHILGCIERIQEYTQGDRDLFFRSSLVQDGVLRNLEVIGEATKQISTDTRTRYSQVPWRRMAGMRDVLIHNYLGVDLNRVWNVVASSLVPLKAQIQAILRELEQPPHSE